MGATAAVNSRSSTDAIEEVMQATGRRGVDVALEAVGLPSTFELCQARPRRSCQMSRVLPCEQHWLTAASKDMCWG